MENLELGDTVEYTLSKGKGNKVSAEKVTKVAAGRQDDALIICLILRYSPLYGEAFIY